MFALRRTAVSLRPTPATASAVPSLFREYHGDPGPSSSSHRTQQNRALRHATISKGRTAVSANRQVLDSILDAPRPNSSIRQKPSYAPSAPASVTRHLRLTTKDEREETPFTTSTRLRRIMAKYPDNPSVPVIDKMVALVTEAKPHMVNAPVWNLLLGYMGRVRKLERMWKLYNDMKKRGIRPTSRTYSTLINAYSGSNHSSDITHLEIAPIEEKTLSRVTILFEQSQMHLRAQLAKRGSDADELGVASKSGEKLYEEGEKNDKAKDLNNEIDLAPVNAYLKFLGRHGLFEEMQKVFVSMDTDGPLAPDTVTYTTMFASLYHVHLTRSWKQDKGQDDKPVPAIGLVARGLWDQCVRQFGKVSQQKQDKDSKRRPEKSTPEQARGSYSALEDQSRRIDNELFLHAIRCFFRGRPEDQRFAQELVQHVWSLPSPGQATLASASAGGASSGAALVPRHLQTLPKLEPNLHSATALLQILSSTNKPLLATHYTTLFLSNSTLQPAFDQRFLKSAIFAYSDTGDIAGVMNILDSYQPLSGSREWDVLVWRAAIQCARWAGDFDAALTLYKRAAQLPEGVDAIGPETGLTKSGKEYEYKTPNGRSRDVRGVNWLRPKPVQPDARMMASLIRTASQGSNRNIHTALNIFDYQGGERAFLVCESEGAVLPLSEIGPDQVELSGKVIRNQLGYALVLARTVGRAIEKLGPSGESWTQTAQKIGDITKTWGSLVAEKQENVGGSARATEDGVDAVPRGPRGYEEGRHRVSVRSDRGERYGRGMRKGTEPSEDVEEESEGARHKVISRRPQDGLRFARKETRGADEGERDDNYPARRAHRREGGSQEHAERTRPERRSSFGQRGEGAPSRGFSERKPTFELHRQPRGDIHDNGDRNSYGRAGGRSHEEGRGADRKFSRGSVQRDRKPSFGLSKAQ